MLRVVLAALALGVAATAAAQAPDKIRRIAYLSGASAEANKPWLSAFDEEMRKLGWAPGEDVKLEVRYLSGRFQQADQLATDLAAFRPDVFMVYGPDAAHALRRVAGSVPIVMANVLDPVASGLIASYARPGGNITGVADSHGSSVTKRLELMNELVPGLSRVGVLWRPEQAGHGPQVRDLERAGQALGVEIIALAVRTPQDIERAFLAMRDRRAGAVIALGDSFLTSHQSRVATLAMENRLPSAYTIRPFAVQGGLISYGTDFREQFRRAATYVDRVLKGANPADLPVMQPEKLELVINLRTARAIGVTVPRDMLLRADHVIE